MEREKKEEGIGKEAEGEEQNVQIEKMRNDNK